MCKFHKSCDQPAKKPCPSLSDHHTVQDGWESVKLPSTTPRLEHVLKARAMILPMTEQHFKTSLRTDLLNLFGVVELYTVYHYITTTLVTKRKLTSGH